MEIVLRLSHYLFISAKRETFSISFTIKVIHGNGFSREIAEGAAVQEKCTVRRGGSGHLFKHIKDDINYKIVPLLLSIPFNGGH